MGEPLKPCPFCGSARVSVHDMRDDWDAAVAVVCRNCDVRGPVDDVETVAVRAWNRRADPAP